MKNGSNYPINFSGIRFSFVQIYSLSVRSASLAGSPFYRRVNMNHSLYSADRQTHRRIVGSAFVAIFVVTLFGVAAISQFEQQAAQPSIAVLRAGIPVATTDGGYFIVR
jgi:hypothetical protein